jgi:phytol kinase
MPPLAAGYPWRPHPVAGMLLTLGFLGALMILLKLYRVKRSPHPELLRKLLHIGMGLVTLSFPWLFDLVWPVVALAGAAVLMLVVLKTPGPLRNLMGGVIDGVDRRSNGDLYFPIAVAILFRLAHGDRLLYCVPILLLTLGDSVAALVGVRYGRLHFTTAEGNKSAEGSLACFVVAFLCTLVPLSLFTRTLPVDSLQIAAIIGLLATLLEAIAWSGLDNLFLPLGGFVLLKAHLAMSVTALSIHLAATILLVAFVVTWRRRTTLNDSAVLGAALYAYCVWSVGGLPWLAAPVILFVAYPLVWPRTGQDAARTHSMSVVLCVGAAGLLWLFLAVAFHLPSLLLAYNVAFGAEMAMIGLARLRHRYAGASGALLLPVSVAASWLLLAAPFLAAATPHALIPVRAVCALCGLAAAAVAFDRIRRDLRDYPCDAARWRLQSALGFVGSAVGAAPLLFGR